MMERYFHLDQVGGWADHMSGFGIAGMVLMIILWIAVMVALVLLIRWLIVRASQTPAPCLNAEPPRTEESATKPATLAILEERYAGGQIGRDEFLERKHDLGLM